jgi:fatty-acyl-CoA synthase
LPQKRPVHLPGIEGRVESGATAIDVSGISRFSQLLASGHADDQHLATTGKTLKATDPINIQFTSGTMGSPKGATLTIGTMGTLAQDAGMRDHAVYGRRCTGE